MADETGSCALNKELAGSFDSSGFFEPLRSERKCRYRRSSCVSAFCITSVRARSFCVSSICVGSVSVSSLGVSAFGARLLGTTGTGAP